MDGRTRVGAHVSDVMFGALEQYPSTPLEANMDHVPYYSDIVETPSAPRHVVREMQFKYSTYPTIQ